MRSDSSDSNINFNNIKGINKNINHDDDYDSDRATYKKTVGGLKNNSKSNSLQKTFTKETRSASNSSSNSKSSRSVSRDKRNMSLSPVKDYKNNQTNIQKNNSYSSRSRSHSTDSRSTRRSKTRSRSVTRSPSTESRNTTAKLNFNHKKINPTFKKPIGVNNNKTKVISNSANNSIINNRKKYTGSNLSKNSSESYPANLNKHYPKRKPVTISNSRENTLPKSQVDETVVRLMSAQRLKNNDLKNKISELNLEIEKLKDENKILKRVHHREEIAIKRFESHDNDVSRLVKNHSDEVHSLRETIKTIKNENRKLNSTLIEKDEEVRNIKKRNEELKKILNDKKLFDSLELSKKLEQSTSQLSEYKAKTETLQRKLEMLEKNHKHEIGVELAHHKETQKNYYKLNEEMKELKAKLEEKERALDMANIYSRVNKDTGRDVSHPLNWKASTQSLNSALNETPREKRKQVDRKKPEQIQKKAEPKLNEKLSSRENYNDKKIEDVQKKHLELELKIKEPESDLKTKDAAEKEKRSNIEQEEKLKKYKEIDIETKEKAEIEIKRNIQEQAKKIENDALEEEERKKRWISEKTIKQLNLEENNNIKVSSKKDELLAKLSLLDNEKNIENTPLIENIPNDFKPTKKNDTIATLPPKPSNQQNSIFNSNEYKFSQTIENLHDGRPANSSRETNKNELLTKLFGNSNNKNNNNNNDVNEEISFSLKQYMQSQSKLDKADDIFSSKSNNNSIITNQTYSTKVNLLPWEINDVNFNTTNNQKASSVVSFGGSSQNINFNTYNTNKNNADNFISLNPNEIDKIKSNHIRNGIMNRPKAENKLIFSSNHHKTNAFVEDIEELTL